MDNGLYNGLYTNTPNGVHNGIYTGTNNGVFNGVFNENTTYNKIIKNGLVLNYDAGFSQSYPKNGNTIYDLTTNNLNGTLTNSPIYKDFNKGVLQFNGTNSYIKPPNNSLLSFNSFTLSSWINTSIQNTNQFIIDTISNASLGNGYSFRITSANLIRFWAYYAGGSPPNVDYIESKTTIKSNQWYNVAVTFNNTTYRQSIYINGVLETTNIISFGYSPSTVSFLQIGGSQLLGFYFNGYMTQHLFYNRDLASNEILQNYQATKLRFT